MNVFLREFCDYGTNPLKSLLLSAYVLLSFAAIYFLYPWQIGGRGSGFYAQLLMFARYFTQKGRLHELPDLPADWAFQDATAGWASAEASSTAVQTPPQKQARAPHFADRDAYQDFIAQHPAAAMPFYFRLFAPRKYGSGWFTRFQRALLRVIDWLPQMWQDYGTARKVLLGSFYGLLIFTLFCSYLFVRFIDAVALSLNVFSTLGFGQIPVSGVPRYLTILEGFIGWFLLSIFSVSLISQIIQ